MAESNIRLNFTGRSQSAEAAAHRTSRAIGEVGTSARTSRGHVLALTGTVAAFGGVIGAVYAVHKAFSAVVDDMNEGARVGAQTAAVIKSTGAVAGVTADQVDRLASALERKSTFDDEAIKSGENMLLTFKNIRNVAGENNDVFNQATKSLVDMAAAYNRSTGSTDGLQKMSIMLGKALNDPITGMTALRRVGVTLDAQQQTQIKTAIKHNDMLAAQKIILRELGSEFGGSALAQSKTFTGQMTVLTNVLTDAGSSILQGFLPALTKATTGLNRMVNSPEFQAGVKRLQNWVNGTLVPMLERFFAWIGQHRGDIADIFRGVAGVVSNVIAALKILRGWLNTVVGQTGGWKRVIEGLILLKFATVIGGWTRAMQGFTGLTALTGVRGANTASGNLLTKINLLKLAGPITIGILLKMEIDKHAPGWLRQILGTDSWEQLGGFFKQLATGHLVKFGSFDMTDPNSFTKPGQGPTPTPTQDPLFTKTKSWLSNPGLRFRVDAHGNVRVIGPSGTVFNTYEVDEKDTLAYKLALQRAQLGSVKAQVAAAKAFGRANVPAATSSAAHEAPSVWDNPGAGHAGGVTGGMPLQKMGLQVYGPTDVFGVFATPGTVVGSPVSGTLLYYHVGGAGPPGGDTLMVKGDDGYTYFMAHLFRPPGNWPQAGDHLEENSPLGVIDRNARPHLHIDKGYRSAKPPKADPLPTHKPPRKPRAAKPTGIASLSALDVVRATAADLREEIPDVAPASLRRRLETDLKAIVDSIGKGISSRDLAGKRRDLADLKKQIVDAVTFTDVAGKVRANQRQFREWLKQGVLTPAEIRSFRADLNAVAVAKQKALDPNGPGGIVPTPKETAAIKTAWDRVNGYQKVVNANIKQRADEMLQASKDTRDALRETVSGWLSSIGQAIQSSGIAPERFGARILAGLKSVGVYLGNVTPADFGTAVAQFKNALNAMVKGGLNASQLESVKAARDAAQGVMSAYIDQLQQAVTGARQTFETAFSRFTDFALRMFDRSRAKLRAGIKVLVAGMMVGEGDLTPAEQALEQASQAQADEEYRRRLDAAKKALAIAKATGEGILDARRAYNDLLLEAQTKALQEQAKLERDAANDQLQAAQQTFDDQASLQRDAFQEELRQIEERMADGTETYQDGLRDVRRVFASYQVPFEDQSDAIGQALSAGLLQAFNAVGVAMQGLATAMDRFVNAMLMAATRAVAVAQTVTQDVQLVYSGMQDFYQVGGAGGEVTPFPGKSFATGGIVGAAGGIWIKGRYTGKDTVPIMAGTGEMVINPEEQDRLFQFLTGRGGGMGGGGISVNVYPQGSVIAERELAETIREALAPVLRANGRQPI